MPSFYGVHAALSSARMRCEGGVSLVPYFGPGFWIVPRQPLASWHAFPRKDGRTLQDDVPVECNWGWSTGRS